MGETISTLVFRPPPPTFIDPDRVFFLDVDTTQESSAWCGAPASSVAADDGVTQHKIACFFIKRRGAKLTVLFSHGNAEDLGMMYNRMKQMARTLCVNVMAYDYSGYGQSTGSPSEFMCYRNVEAAYNYLLNVRKIPPSNIVLYGRSLGSGPSSYLAAKSAREGNSVAGLILHSPFLSVYRVVVDCGVTLVGDMFPNLNHLPNIRCPVLIIHGTKDEVVPFWHGRRLLQLLPEEYRAPPFWAEGWGHNNIEVYLKKLYINKVNDFLDRYVVKDRKNGKREHSINSICSGPAMVPESERAEDASASHANRFFVNSTWVRHGAHIINEAMNTKKVSDEARKQEQSYQNTVPLPPPINVETEGRDPPDNMSEQLQHRGDVIRSPRRGERVKRFLTTRDEYFPDDRDGGPAENDSDGDSFMERERRRSKGSTVRSLSKYNSTHAVDPNMSRTRGDPRNNSRHSTDIE
mmetsp:Transcript_17558/g.26157  ORF Transcript_17558/g.26157 Transcript_17558/m.26157 type:complete len:463 (-) Transcript_17558:367-1755(-)